jgi:uncharacterized membrane protein required for colicin V production
VAGSPSLDGMAETSSPWTGSLALRILLAAVVVFIALSIIGWVVGIVVSVLRAMVVIAAVLAIAWIALGAARR